MHMKKFLFSLIAFAIIAPAAVAESGANQSFVSSPLGQNWEVSVGLGTQFYMGEEDWGITGAKSKFLDWWTFPSIDVNLSKWITPIFGFGIDIAGIRFKGLGPVGGDNTFAKAGDAVDANTGLAINKGWYINPNFNLNISLVNLFAGYRPDRKYNLIAELGAGAAVTLSNPKTIWATTMNARLRNQFKLSEKLKLDITIGGALVGDDFDGESYATSAAAGAPVAQNIGLDGVFSATAGLNYAFNFSKKAAAAGAIASAAAAGAWVSMADVEEEKKAEVAAEQAKVAEAAEDNAKKDAELAAAKKAAEDAEAARAAAEKALADAQANANKYGDLDVNAYVNYLIGSSTISNREMINVENVAKLISAMPNQKFIITGYADKATGSAKRNAKLAQARAESVYKALTQKYGVNADQLTVESKGGVAPFLFNENQLSRAAIVTIVK